MVMGRNQPSEWVRQNARLDSLTAEVAVERAVMNARLEGTRRYFDVLQREEAQKHLKAAARQYEETRRRLKQRSKSNGATVIDGATWELRLIATESEVDGADEALAQAKSALAALVGDEDSADVLQLASWGESDAPLNIPDRTMLRQVVIGRKGHQSGVMQSFKWERNV
jgi:outer membrane protein TolC